MSPSYSSLFEKRLISTPAEHKGPLTVVVAQPLAGDPRAIFRAAENESFSPEKHVISTRAEYRMSQGELTLSAARRAYRAGVVFTAAGVQGPTEG